MLVQNSLQTPFGFQISTARGTFAPTPASTQALPFQEARPSQLETIDPSRTLAHQTAAFGTSANVLPPEMAASAQKLATTEKVRQFLATEITRQCTGPSKPSLDLDKPDKSETFYDRLRIYLDALYLNHAAKLLGDTGAAEQAATRFEAEAQRLSGLALLSLPPKSTALQQLTKRARQLMRGKHTATAEIERFAQEFTNSVHESYLHHIHRLSGVYGADIQGSFAAIQARVGNWDEALASFEKAYHGQTHYNRNEATETLLLARLIASDGLSMDEMHELKHFGYGHRKLTERLDKTSLIEEQKNQLKLVLIAIKSIGKLHPIRYTALAPEELTAILKETRFTAREFAAFGDFVSAAQNDVNFDTNIRNDILQLAQEWLLDLSWVDELGWKEQQWSAFQLGIDSYFEHQPPEYSNRPSTLSIQELCAAHPIFCKKDKTIVELKLMITDVLLRLTLLGWQPGQDLTPKLIQSLLVEKRHNLNLPLVTQPGINGKRIVINGHHRLVVLLLLVGAGYLPRSVLDNLRVQVAKIKPEQRLKRVSREVNPSAEDLAVNWLNSLPFDLTELAQDLGLDLSAPLGSFL